MALASGAQFGHYVIESVLGRGGMGAVYLATDERLGRRVALKLLSSELASQPAFRERFIAESRTAASLDHPHIVPIYEAGAVDDQLFIAMRYVDGVDLGELIKRDGPLPPARAVAIAAQVADALDAAHAAGLIHRDVKPGNILLARTGAGADHAYLTDFGLTKRAAYGAALTRTGELVGTVDYVAPEQIEGRPIDARVDVYSLGCVLFEALTGAPPFRRETELAVLYAHVQASLPSAHALRADVPAALDEVLARAVAKEPAARYGSAGELARAASQALAASTPAEAATRGFLFADLRGYTAYTERHGDDAGAALLERYRRLVRQVIGDQQGAEVRTEGDSFYVLFPSASRAVAAGLAVVAAAAADAKDHPDAPIQVGVGIHAGETAETAEGPVGTAVNLAARICSAAVAGEVLVSDTVRGLTRTRRVAGFEPAGARRLKGIAEPLTLYRAVPATDAAATATAASSRRRPLPLSGLPLVAVIVLAAVLVIGPAYALLAGLGRGTPTPAPPTAGSQTPATITGTGGVAGSASPSAPTGTRILFSRQVALADDPNNPDDNPSCDGIADAKLYVLDPDHPEAVPYRLTSATDLFERDPTWSFDGAAIVFTGDIQNRAARLFAMAPDRSAPRELERAGTFDRQGPRHAVMSADGRQVIFAYSDGFVVEPIDGGDPREVVMVAREPEPTEQPQPSTPGPSASGPTPAPPPTQPPTPSPLPVDEQTIDGPADAAWLPDGRALVLVPVAESTGPPRMQFQLRDIDGHNPQALSVDLGAAAPERLAVSPDGKSMAISLAPFVQHNPDGSDTYGKPRIFVAPLVGGGLQPVTPADLPATSPAWSPDGKRIAFAGGEPGQTQIWVTNVATAEAAQLSHLDDAFACSPAWAAAPSNLAGPAPSPSPGQPLPFERGVLPAGRYLVSLSQPNIELTLPDGWWSRRNYVDGFALAQVGPSGGEAELDTALIQVAFTGPCGLETESTTLDQKPLAVMDWLKSRDDLAVTPPLPVNMGGYPGLSADVTLKDKGCPDFGDEDPLSMLFPSGQDTYHITRDEKIRFIVVAVRGTAVSILVDAIRADIFDGFAEAVQPILDSITFPSP